MPPAQSGEGPLGKPWLSRQPVLSLRPPTSSPHYSLVLCQREWEGEGEFEVHRRRKRKRKRGGEHKAEQTRGNWPAGEKRRAAARRVCRAASPGAGATGPVGPTQPPREGMVGRATVGSPEARGNFRLLLPVTYMAMGTSPTGTSQNPRQTPLTEAGSLSQSWNFSISGLCHDAASCLFLISSQESSWWVREGNEVKGIQDESRCYRERNGSGEGRASIFTLPTSEPRG